MNTYIICEGTLDAQLLKRVLPIELVNNVEIVAAGGVSAAKSLARSLLVRRQVPIAVVVDADSVDPDLVQENLRNFEEIVESVSVNTPVKIIFAVPEIEIIFFQDSLLLSRLVGYEPSQDVLTWATFQPRKALEELFSQSPKNHLHSQIINQLTDEDLEILRKAPMIQELIHFLQSVQEVVETR